MKTGKSLLASHETSPEGMTEQCQYCLRWFKNKRAIGTHLARRHMGKGWSTTANLRPRKKTTRAEILERKKIYNANVRAANRAKGLTSAGNKRKRPLRAPYGVSMKPYGGNRWSPAQRRKHKATWAAKRNGLIPGQVIGTVTDPKAKNKNIPRDRKELAAQLKSADEYRAEIPLEQLKDPRAYINCCPNCGYNLKAHYVAAGFKQDEPQA